MEKVPMTRRGYEKILEELKHLKTVERPRVIQSIATARMFGDLSENAEYHAAKDKQGFVESRIVDLENKISRADVYDTSKINSDCVQFGATIVIADEDGKDSIFQIVGSEESDVKSGCLPVGSPLAKALIGKKVGDLAEVFTPNGTKEYFVVSIKYI
jgi:transcription elongation factor GreA